MGKGGGGGGGGGGGAGGGRRPPVSARGPPSGRTANKQPSGQVGPVGLWESWDPWGIDAHKAGCEL